MRMASTNEWATKAECLEFLQSVFNIVDSGDHEGYANCFLPDGAWDRRRAEPPLVGPEAIRGFFGDGPPTKVTRHVTGGMQVWLDGPESARAKTQMTLFVGPAGEFPIKITGPTSVVEYDDELVRTDAGWRFKLRRTTVVFSLS